MYNVIDAEHDVALVVHVVNAVSDNIELCPGSSDDIVNLSNVESCQDTQFNTLRRCFAQLTEAKINVFHCQ